MQSIGAPPDTVNALLTGAGLDRADAKVLLRHALGCNDAWLIAHGTDRVDADICRRYREFVARRNDGEPVAYITGTREFFGRDFSVTPAVLIPRPETELLIERALQIIGADDEADVLDLGAGSGCIGISIAAERPHTRVTLIEKSPAALAVARDNASRWAPDNTVVNAGDWLAGVSGHRFHLVVSNPPYIAEDDPHLGQGDLRFEPTMALAAGPQGMDALRTIIGEAPRHLHPGGWLLLEHGYDQGESCREALYKAGFTGVFTETDLAGQPRVSGGQLPGR